MRRSPIPSVNSVPRDLRLEESGGSKNMLVDGSSVAVDFKFAPAGGEVVFVKYITLLTVSTVAMPAGSFGNRAILSNGLLVNAQTNGVVIPTITTLRDNEDIMQCFGGVAGSVGQGSNQGVFESGRWIAGQYIFDDKMVLFGDLGDFIAITVRDDLSTGITVLQASCRVVQVLPQA